MNTKLLLYLSCFLATTLAAPIVNAGPHRSGGNHFAGVGARTGGGGVRPFVGGNRFAGAWNGARWNGQHWNGNHWNNWNGNRWNNWNGNRWNNWNGNRWNNWNWHHHDHDDFFFSSFGFPFWGLWGVPWWYGSYYPYGYPYGYYGGGGYYGNGYYGNGYNYGYGYNNGYSNRYGNNSNVRDLQRKLADGGYYHGPIDGIMGSRTEHALRAYRYDQRNGNVGGSSPTLRSRPYSPPPVTTEPDEPSE